MRERAQYRRQKAAKAQSQVILKQNEQNIMVDIENAVTAVQISFQQVSATRQEREFAEAALGAEEKKLEVGKSSFIVLQLQRDLTTARSNEINALTSYNLNIANLAYLEGRTLTDSTWIWMHLQLRRKTAMTMPTPCLFPTSPTSLFRTMAARILKPPFPPFVASALCCTGVLFVDVQLQHSREVDFLEERGWIWRGIRKRLS